MIRPRLAIVGGIFVAYAANALNLVLAGALFPDIIAAYYVSIFAASSLLGAICRMGLDKWLAQGVNSKTATPEQKAERVIVAVFNVCVVGIFGGSALLLYSWLVFDVGSIAQFFVPVCLACTSLFGTLLRSRGHNLGASLTQNGAFSLLALTAVSGMYFSNHIATFRELNLVLFAAATLPCVFYACYAYSLYVEHRWVTVIRSFSPRISSGAAPFAAVHTTTILINQVDIVLVGMVCDSSTVVAYSAVTRALMGMSFPLVAVNFWALNELSKSTTADASACAVYRMASRLSAAGALAMISMIVFVAVSLPQVWSLGEGFRQLQYSSVLFFAAALSQASNAYTGPINLILQFIGKHYWVLIAQCTSLALILAALLISLAFSVPTVLLFALCCSTFIWTMTSFLTALRNIPELFDRTATFVLAANLVVIATVAACL